MDGSRTRVVCFFLFAVVVEFRGLRWFLGLGLRISGFRGLGFSVFGFRV